MKNDLEGSFAHVVQAVQRHIAAVDAALRATAEEEPAVREMLVRKTEARERAAAATLDAVSDEFCNQIRDTIKSTVMQAIAAMPATNEGVAV